MKKISGSGNRLKATMEIV